MASSDTEIVNSALIKIGADRITSIDDNVMSAILMKEQFPKVRDELLRSHPWNFAKKRVELGLTTETPAFGFDYQFQLPAECLRIIETSLDNIDDWQREGDYLVTNSSSVSIQYIAKVTDIAKWDSNFCEALAWQLAADLCMAITQNAQRAKDITDMAAKKLATSRSFNGQEGTPKQPTADSWLTSRF